MPQENKTTILDNITPNDALRLLKEGNFRFVNNLQINNLRPYQVNKIKLEQWPFAAVFSCMDSRTSAELIFDLGMGDIFSIRMAGNVVSENVLGSLEYAAAIVGSKLILVLGHTDCGAIKGACDDVQLGNLTGLLNNIKPAIAQETTITQNRTSKNKEFVDAVAGKNVVHTVTEILARSPIINDLVKQGKLGIASAMYDIATGKITFGEQAITGDAISNNIQEAQAVNVFS